MPIRKGYIDVTGGQVHYRRAGEPSDAPIVMFHMTASTSESYDPLITALGERVDSIAIDTPNYGESFKTDREATMQYIAEVMIEALEAMGVTKYHLVGHHTGASIAAEMAALVRDRVLSATLSGLVSASPNRRPNSCGLECLRCPYRTGASS